MTGPFLQVPLYKQTIESDELRAFYFHDEIRKVLASGNLNRTTVEDILGFEIGHTDYAVLSADIEHLLEWEAGSIPEDSVEAARWGRGLEQSIFSLALKLNSLFRELFFEGQKARRAMTRDEINEIISPEFLGTWEWRDLRNEAFEKYGNRCQCCGATSEDAVLNVDHVIPRKVAPERALDLWNLQILCDACNHGKANKIQDFRSNNSDGRLTVVLF